MNIERFTTVLASYGASESRWPEAERAALADFVTVNPTARALLVEAQQLDDLLDTWTPATPAHLEADIMAALPRPYSERLLDWLLAPGAWLRPGFAAAMMLTCGVVIGGFYPDGDNAEDTGYWNDDLALMALDDNFDEDVTNDN